MLKLRGENTSTPIHDGGGMLRIVWEKQYQAISWGQGYLGAVYYNLAGAYLVYGGRCRYITTTSQFSPTYISQHLHQFIFEIVMKWFVFYFHRHHHPHHNLVICPKSIGHAIVKPGLNFLGFID